MPDVRRNHSEIHHDAPLLDPAAGQVRAGRPPRPGTIDPDTLPAMRLTRLFALSLLIVALLVSALIGSIVVEQWQHYRATRAALQSMELARRAMVAAEKVSYERGPANGVLGDAAPADPAKRERLARVRADSDAALDDLARLLTGAAGPATAQALAAVRDAQAGLSAARRQVDTVSGMPPEQRSSRAVMGAVQSMFDVIPLLLEAVTSLSDAVAEIDSRFIGALTNARLAVELREYAGRIGSQFTAALATDTPLTQAERRALVDLRGRVAQLHDLIERPVRAGGADPRVATAMRQMQERYFGEGLAFIADIERRSDAMEAYGMDAAGFAARYVPYMGSIVALRDVLLDVSIEGAREASTREARGLAIAGTLGLIVLAGLAMLMLDMRRRVLLPLLSATRALIDTASGQAATAPPASARRDEIGDMLRALAVLHANTQEMHRLAHERQRLIEELRELSSTDPLTGALNRRAFDDLARRRLSGTGPDAGAVAIVLFDIDHFKAINDRHGHEAGDQVLRHVADLVRAELRDGEPLARYGGEEFIAMPRRGDLADAAAVAERLRLAIEHGEVPLPDGHRLRVTASFGVAAAPDATFAVDTVIRAADRALYRAKALGRNRVVSTDGIDLPAPA